MNRRQYLVAVGTAAVAGCAGQPTDVSCERRGGTEPMNVGTDGTITDPGGYWPTPTGPYDGTRSVRDPARFDTTPRPAWRREVPDRGDVLLAGGRLYVTDDSYDPEQIVALDPTDGRLLWETPTPEFEAEVIAGPDRLYAVDAATMLVFDPETRTTARPFSFEWKYDPAVIVAVDGDQVFFAGGDPRRLHAVVDGSSQWSVPISQGLKNNTGAAISDGVMYVTDYKRLRAIAVDTGEVLWEQSGSSFRGRHVSVQGDRLFLSGNGVAAVDATTGEPRWRHPAPPGRTVRAAVGRRQVFVRTQTVDGTGSRLFTYDHTDSTPIACGQLSPFVNNSDVVTDGDLQVTGGVIKNSDKMFVQARRPGEPLVWRIVRDGRYPVRLCAGRDALFLRYGSTLEAISLS
ncbi:MAG: WD40 repeat protein [halophilic archaeon J07HB67]|nr:MAG: WD40 repeat protein [halophilic archaeon J07HB67]